MGSFRQGFEQLLKGSILGRLFGTAANLVLSRSLGVTGFGGLSLYLQLIQTCEILCRCGLDYALSYWTAADSEFSKRRSRDLARTALQLSLALSCVTVVASTIYTFNPAFHFPWNESTVQHQLQIAVLVAIASECLASMLWEILLIQRRLRCVSLRQVLFGPLKLLMASLGGIIGQIDGAMIGWLIGSICQLAWLTKTTPTFQVFRHGAGKAWKTCASYLARKGIPFYTTNLISQVVFFPLLVSVASTAGIGDVGFLRVGQICAQLFGLLSGSLTPILFLNLRSTNDDTAQQALLNRSLAASWAFSLMVFAIFCMVDHPLIQLGFGSTYVGGIPATRLLVGSAILDSLAQILQQALLARGRVNQLTFVQNSAGLVSAAAGWMLVPRMGLTGYLISRGLYSLLPLLSTVSMVKLLQPGLALDWKLSLGTLLMIAIVSETMGAPGLSWIHGQSPLVLSATFGLGLLSVIQQGWLRPRT